ncbi:PH domain-containing protein [Xanthovirga aplysinae]|uniref:PH domain-containing protein n=1 Tax=Xanthovirga aplysinae TaxID=2529853 RepID=UPI0012BD0022|nr:PH domain-containing protein [Xanthovirga aplysinae]MTI31722.1 hypothetical protein [Xanthovirga aplysinae]
MPEIVALFKSRKDALITTLVWLIVLVPVLIIGYGTPLMAEGIPKTLTHMFGALIAAVVMWMWISTFYIVKGDILFYQSGPFRGRVAINQITKIEKTFSSKVAPALSRDRFRIIFNEDEEELLVSPEDEGEFIATLKKINPKIQLNL